MLKKAVEEKKRDEECLKTDRSSNEKEDNHSADKYCSQLQLMQEKIEQLQKQVSDKDKEIEELKIQEALNEKERNQNVQSFGQVTLSSTAGSKSESSDIQKRTQISRIPLLKLNDILENVEQTEMKALDGGEKTPAFSSNELQIQRKLSHTPKNSPKKSLE